MTTQLVRLRPRPDTLYVSQNRSVLATGRNGFIDEGPDHGFFVHGTRLLSQYRYRLNGEAPLPNGLSNVDQHTWLGYYIAAPSSHVQRDRTEGPGGTLAQHPVELRLSRYVDDGFHEDVDITNFTQAPTRFPLELLVDGDFCDIAETKGPRQQHGTIERDWRQLDDDTYELSFRYHATHKYEHQGHTGVAQIDRAVRLRFTHASSPPEYRNGVVRFVVDLVPHARWHVCVDGIAEIDGREFPAQYRCRSFEAGAHPYDLRRKQFLARATRFSAPGAETLGHVVVGALNQACRDLAALRLYDVDVDQQAWTMAAGLPVYVALFGRDTLTAAWQAATASFDMMRGTLAELARWQGTEWNDWRDEQPGKMLHQAETGPLAMLNVHPLRRYYGSITTSGFYPVVVAELWHWTGDKELVRPFIEPALRAIRWLDQHGDLDADGFYEYRTRSEQGLRNQGWKDSDDAIVHQDGSQAPVPVATCEEQGFAYLAKLHMSEVLWWLGEKDDARRLFRDAQELKERFNDVFWMDDLQCVAMGLDGAKRPIASVGSNAGHCLATGLLDDRVVTAVADRLFADDMFSGWGIRTLSSQHPAYNPYSYHRGSIWPVEQASFAVGFARYGLHQQVQRISRAQFEAATVFDFYRLPEVFGGHQRDADHPFPPHYPGANSPQAWSASAVFCLVQAMLSLYPYAPLNLLLVDPHLPEWLPEITLRGLRVGASVVDIRFHRTPDGRSDYEVLDKRGPLHIVRQPSPWSLTATFGERLRDALTSLVA